MYNLPLFEYFVFGYILGDLKKSCLLFLVGVAIIQFVPETELLSVVFCKELML